MRSIIKVEGLSKQYSIGGRHAPYATLRESLVESLKSPFGRGRNGRGEKFFALKDVCFEIAPGDVVGIVGRNGAGKSTVLKILSRITEPTRGRVELYGRVGSLLEVGTGFHPELTGRENIFLNGAILGMRRGEIARKFDEIVDFAEIEKFIDTPVKFYSSGMYMRLAFAVAAHLESEILVVDEVLAVGDSQFQKKCLGKMEDVSHRGRTVLFVSHNLSSLNRLCRSGIYLEAGHLREHGSIQTVLAKYQNDRSSGESGLAAETAAEMVKENEIRFTDWHLEGSASNQHHVCFSREEVTFVFTLVCRRPLAQAVCGFVLFDENEQMMVSGNSLFGEDAKAFDLVEGTYDIRWRVTLPLKSGNYKILVEAGSLDTPGKPADTWYPPNPVMIMPVSENNLPEEWQGVLNVQTFFSCEPRK